MFYHSDIIVLYFQDVHYQILHLLKKCPCRMDKMTVLTRRQNGTTMMMKKFFRPINLQALLTPTLGIMEMHLLHLKHQKLPQLPISSK
jgi:hypothetical protein